MRSLYRFSFVLAGVLASFGAQSHADAGFIPVSRLSEITFDGLGIGTGGEPGPDQAKSTTDLTAPFDEVLVGSSSDREPGGALDSGIWNIRQTTTIGSGVITSDNSQFASVSTNFGSPLIIGGSTFRFDFQVDSVTQVLLEGSLVGSSNPADNPFARVQLKQGAGTLFNSGFPSGTFPFLTTLQPNLVHTLAVDVSGESLFNDTTTSSANVTLSIVSSSVPEPSSLTLVGLGLIGLIVCGRTRGSRGWPNRAPGR